MQSSVAHLLSRRFGTLLMSGVIVAALFVGVSFFLPLEYRADAQVLIISRSRFGVDPYTVVKSAERIGENIVQVVKTNDFYTKVMTQPNTTIDRSTFENVPERTKRRRWQKAVSASVIYGTGILNVNAYSTDPKQALSLAGAAAAALVGSAPEYVGGDVAIKIVNEPVVSRFPVRPNLPMNAAFGFGAGVLLAFILLLRKQSRA